MKTAYIAATAFFTTLFFSSTLMAEDGLTGRQIQENYETITTVPYEYQEQEITLIDRGGNEQVRKMRRYTRTDNDKTKSLVVFDSPSSIRGVATLSWEQEGEDSRWLYLPADGSMKRISGGGKRNYFMGTDITYEDMDSEDLNEYEYKRQDNQTLDGKELYVVDVYPLADNIKKDTAYSYQRRYYDPDTFFIVRTDYYDKNGKLQKTAVAEGVHETSKPGIFRNKGGLFDNFQNSHKTKIVIEKYEFDEGKVPEQIFTERYISSGRYMRDAGS
jgi:hypothetical protein